MINLAFVGFLFAGGLLVGWALRYLVEISRDVDIQKENYRFGNDDVVTGEWIERTCPNPNCKCTDCTCNPCTCESSQRDEKEQC